MVGGGVQQTGGNPESARGWREVQHAGRVGRVGAAHAWGGSHSL